MGKLTMTPEIEEFAKALVEFVRDASIRSNDVDLRSTAASPVAKRWKIAARAETSTEFAHIIIPDVVDETKSDSSMIFRIWPGERRHGRMALEL